MNPANQAHLHVQCTVRNRFIYSVVDTTLDHLLASPEDGPGVGMGMVEGSGGASPTAVVTVTEMINLRETEKDLSFVHSAPLNHFNWERELTPLFIIYLKLVCVIVTTHIGYIVSLQKLNKAWKSTDA